MINHVDVLFFSDMNLVTTYTILFNTLDGSFMDYYDHYLIFLIMMMMMMIRKP